jgi:hypothetical protein
MFEYLKKQPIFAVLSFLELVSTGHLQNSEETGLVLSSYIWISGIK